MARCPGSVQWPEVGYSHKGRTLADEIGPDVRDKAASTANVVFTETDVALLARAIKQGNEPQRPTLGNVLTDGALCLLAIGFLVGAWVVLHHWRPAVSVSYSQAPVLTASTCTINGDTSQPVIACNFGNIFPGVNVSGDIGLDQLSVTCADDPVFEVSVLSGAVDVVAPDGEKSTVIPGEQLSCGLLNCQPSTASFSLGQRKDFSAQSNAPAVTSLSPVSGSAQGGTRVSIAGTGFAQGEVVDFGTQQATNVKVAASTTITATTPPGAGPVHVTVTVHGATSETSSLDVFTYPTEVSPPGAGLTFPNGAIVNFDGIDYVLAGGTPSR